jgi:hypothetical protein
MIEPLESGIKTMTRRLLHPQPVDPDQPWPNGASHVTLAEIAREPAYYVKAGYCPFGRVGDRLWVREHWRTIQEYDEMTPLEIVARHRTPDLKPPFAPIHYSNGKRANWPGGEPLGRWRNARYMPRVFSRFFLNITNIRPEPLHAITNADAAMEGITWKPGEWSHGIAKFAAVWNDIHDSPEGKWEANPWVWVISFELDLNDSRLPRKVKEVMLGEKE